MILIDQILDIIILGCYCLTFLRPADIQEGWKQFSLNAHFWKLALAIIFLTMPTSYIVGIATKGWRDKITTNAKDTLSNAGQWVGIIARIIVLVLVLYDRYFIKHWHRDRYRDFAATLISFL